MLGRDLRVRVEDRVVTDSVLFSFESCCHLTLTIKTQAPAASASATITLNSWDRYTIYRRSLAPRFDWIGLLWNKSSSRNLAFVVLLSRVVNGGEGVSGNLIVEVCSLFIVAGEWRLKIGQQSNSDDPFFVVFLCYWNN
ncbi:hypothetical protein VNO78_18515 [Psophocarpus tetragonolobus]|uniref:Uncharacterized protein n=1 Tax=Psophocarpus tetragonolobus TaxID=3891 RepID=A0AAN9XM94_PSOTE